MYFLTIKPLKEKYLFFAHSIRDGFIIFFFTSRVARDAKHIFDCLLYSYRCKASKGYVLKETCAWRVVEAYGLHHINLFLLFQIIALNVLLLNYGAET